MCGPTVFAVAGVAPAPKFQLQEEAFVEASVTVTVCPVHTVEGDVVKAAVAAANPVILILSTNKRLPYPDKFLNATTTLDCPTYVDKSTVSVLHCAAVGEKAAVVAAAVASVVFDLL